MEYKAFISYKHLISTEFAKDLEYHIKRYAKNVFQKPDKIFRDEQYLKTGGDLTALIKSALKNADYLILLASPEAAISPWVISELEIWCNELKRADKIIVVLTSGSIHIDGIKKEIDWEKTDALPHLLKEHLPVLPLFVDLSWAAEKKSRVLSNGKYKTAINAIAASIRDITPNELNGIEWKIRRKNLMIAYSVAGILFCLLVTVVIGLFQLQKTNTNLEKSIRLATSRQLAATSQLEAIPASLETAARSVILNQNNESVFSLLKATSDHQTLYRHVIKLPDAIKCLGFIEKTKQLYTLWDDQIIILDWHGKRSSSIQVSKMPLFREVILSPYGTIGASSSELWNISARKRIASVDNYISVFKIDPISGNIFIGLANGKVLLVDPTASETKELYTHKAQVTGISIGKDFIVSTALTMETPVVYYSLPDKKIKRLARALFSANAVDISGDFARMAIGYENSIVAVYQLPEMSELWQEELNYSVSELQYHPDNKTLAAASASGEIVIYNDSGAPLDQWQAVSGGVWEMQWVGDTLVSGGSDGWIRSWLPHQAGTAWKKYRNADAFYWQQEELIGFERNKVYNLHTGRQLASIKNWESDKILDAHPQGLLTVKNNKLHFYQGGTYAHQAFPGLTDSLQVYSSKLTGKGDVVVSSWRPVSSYSGVIRGAISLWDLKDNSVTWLDSVPDFPKSIDMFNNELLACSGSDAIAVWDLKTNKLISKANSFGMKPIERLTFHHKDQILIGHLMGKIAIVSTKDPDKVIYSSEIPTGSIYDLCVLKDSSIISIDVDGVRWFDKQLNYLGQLVNTNGHRSMVAKTAVSGSNQVLGIKTRSGKIETLSLNINEIAHRALGKAKTMYQLKNIIKDTPEIK